LLHNAPIGSLDFPASNFATAAIQRFGVRILFAIGTLLRKTYLQTIILRPI